MSGHSTSALCFRRTRAISSKCLTEGSGTGPLHIIEQVHRGEPVDPSAYYFRTAIFFETGSERYAWMNKILAIGSGYREPAGPRYQVFEVL